MFSRSHPGLRQRHEDISDERILKHIENDFLAFAFHLHRFRTDHFVDDPDSCFLVLGVDVRQGEINDLSRIREEDTADRFTGYHKVCEDVGGIVELLLKFFRQSVVHITQLVPFAFDECIRILHDASDF